MAITNDYDVYMNNLYRQQAMAMSQSLGPSFAQIGMMRGMSQQSLAGASHNPPKTTASNASTDLLLLTIEGDTE